jgi:hypothetical protein
VMRVDHHCFWMGNSCIGFLNHKFFMLYLLYLTKGLFITTLPFIYQILWLELGFFEMIINSITRSLAFYISAALFLGIFGLLALQTRMMLLNQTTYEVAIDFRLRPFRHKLNVKNIQAVFGRRKRDWLNPFRYPFTLDEGIQANEFISSIIPTMKFNF